MSRYDPRERCEKPLPDADDCNADGPADQLRHDRAGSGVLRVGLVGLMDSLTHFRPATRTRQVSVVRKHTDRAAVHIDQVLLGEVKHSRLQVAIGLLLEEAGNRGDTLTISATVMGYEYRGTAAEYLNAAGAWSDVHTPARAAALLKEATR